MRLRQRAIKLLVQNHPKSKERVSENILNIIFDVDLISMMKNG